MNDKADVLPKVARTSPFKIDVEAGKTYYWCTCGLSNKQPFCDGSHKGSVFSPVKYDATAAGDVWFCGCKRSAKAPLCDGTHKKL
jgi:CDGSH-type Zn-finger protein